MAASGVGLFHADVAVDVRREHLDLLANGVSDTEAFRTMVREWKESIADADDGPVFWLALAATQWEYGRLHPRAKSKALKVINQGKSTDRWADAGAAKKRQAVLAQLKKKLLAPLPKNRTPRVRAIADPPSFSSASPDRTAEATAWLIGAGSERPNSQVYITMKVKRSVETVGHTRPSFTSRRCCQIPRLFPSFALPSDAEAHHRRSPRTARPACENGIVSLLIDQWRRGLLERRDARRTGETTDELVVRPPRGLSHKVSRRMMSLGKLGNLRMRSSGRRR